ncbi:MAG: 4-hydroxy-tetrahydrodipicolinate reductase [Bacillota bacterium]|nr:MAG: 4-hydroxy-tetrahydrodipicolinate reductase [Bacillota bacterium]
MGREVLQAVMGAPDLLLVGAVSRAFRDEGSPDVPTLQGELASDGIATFSTVAACLGEARPEVLVEFTNATVSPSILRQALDAGVRPVSGTTGIPGETLRDIDRTARRLGLGCVVAPNFSLGATVLAITARVAAGYFKTAEIIEMHHDQKVDAPSGTALALARLVGAHLDGSAARPGAGAAGGSLRDAAAGRDQAPTPVRPVQAGEPATVVERQPSRGVEVGGVPVHSVRLSGLVAHHEIIFGSSGETFTLRHDSASRASFMPGVLLAVRKVRDITGLVTSLEDLLGLAQPG